VTDLSKPVDALVITGLLAASLFIVARGGRLSDAEFLALCAGLVLLALLVTRVRHFLTTESFLDKYGERNLVSLPRKMHEVVAPRLKKVADAFKSAESDRDPDGHRPESVAVDAENMYLRSGDDYDGVREEYKYLTYLVCRLKHSDFDAYKRLIGDGWIPKAEQKLRFMSPLMRQQLSRGENLDELAERYQNVGFQRRF